MNHYKATKLPILTSSHVYLPCNVNADIWERLLTPVNPLTALVSLECKLGQLGVVK